LRISLYLRGGESTLPDDQFSPNPGTAYRQRILRLPEVCAVTGLGRSFIYQLQAADSFPQRVKLGVCAVGWLEDEVQRRVSDKVAENRQRRSETE
jgi:prophage regulatory protein